MEPRNIAPPQWECPICRTNHRSNYDAAVECIAKGEPDTPELPPIVVYQDEMIGALATAAIRPIRDAHIRPVILELADRTGNQLSRDMRGDTLTELINPDLADNILRVPGTDELTDRYAPSVTTDGSALYPAVFGLRTRIDTASLDRGEWWRSPTVEQLAVITELGMDKPLALNADKLDKLAGTPHLEQPWISREFASSPAVYQAVQLWACERHHLNPRDRTQQFRFLTANWAELCTELADTIRLWLAATPDTYIPLGYRLTSGSSGAPTSKAAPGKKRMELFQRVLFQREPDGSKGRADDWRAARVRLSDLLRTERVDIPSRTGHVG